AGVPCHPAGAQLSQLTLDPPWVPVLWGEKVTLSCRGSGEPGATTTWWHNHELLQWAQGLRHLPSTQLRRGTYRCRGPGAEISPPLSLSFSHESLVLQVPPRALLEGDELWLRCRH
ncbi:FCGR3 protein, partial [Rostratula benghalensis]|nr:FCGR3 protein [Rostratula benghalensis]